MLTDVDRAVLEAAHLRGRARVARSTELGLGLTGLSVRLLQLLDDPAAEAAYPVVVHRERRLRDARRAARAARWGHGGH